PHAGDGGVTGTEETDIITPAIADATAAKVLAFGRNNKLHYIAGM
ncbi:MAG: 4-hydroxythreonine-4-phosphate dehydrogenase PdxA, partial [Clostridia bacterium]|nr:4-hydroxythreonine-4-phosphate dehydrogenase PdxA [Clostridia bacterium]